MKLIISLILIAVLCSNANSSVLTFRASAYCHNNLGTCGKKSKGITASGTKVRHGVIAADWKILPRGTKIKILEPKEVAGIYTVEDKGGKRIRGNFIDIWMRDKKTAIRWGIRKIKLEIIK